LTIPASQVVSVTPSVISGGGSGLDLVGVMLTNSARMPTGTLLSFPTSTSVSSYFGPLSTEAALAATYFLGFNNSNIKPAALLYYAYPSANVGAWLRGATPPGGTALTAIQAISGTLIVTVDGVVKTAASLNLSGVGSLSAAAQSIETGLGITGPSLGTITASIATTTLTVTVDASVVLAVGQKITGGGVAAGTYITAFVGGTGNTGTYTVSVSQTVSSASLTVNTAAVTYDSIAAAFQVNSATTGASSTISYGTGTTALALGLSQAAGATTSQGQVAGVAATTMAAVIALGQNWVSFMTTFDPDGGSGNTQKLAFATWTNQQSNRYLYAAWDTDITATQANNTTSLGAILQAGSYSGTACLYAPTLGATEAAFLMGSVASLDFSETNGRATMAFKSQDGITPDVTDATKATNLIANNYNFYGSYATANDQFQYLYPGQVSGQYDWIDSYVNQIWLNNALQLALLSLMTQVKALPYNRVGYDLVGAAMQDPIDAALNFGAIAPGVPLSNAQAAEVNTAAGVKIDQVLGNVGYYRQVKAATAQVRSLRRTPPITLWYMDGGSIQQINIASVEVQ
jgi:hypothetical protein